ncbi:MAG TPA: isoleucine--tRNA ligase [Patescibacteria group bacterium]
MANKYFESVDPKVNFPELENKIIKFWKGNDVFKESVESRPVSKKWNFLDGPPFITGLPHYGSLLSSIPKDLFPRFWTMKGYRVRRVWGWDCHGLPAENKVETKLGLKSKRDIEEKIGVKKFIDECKSYVSEVSNEWEWYVDHVGRWVDFKNAYKTMDLSYMESVMWVFKNMYDKGHIYKGLRVSLYCPHDSTPISNFEVAMDPEENYKDVTEPADTYKYKVKGEEDTYLLAWSTTPWNKLATPALAVNPKLTYVKVKQGGKYYILAKTTLKILNQDDPYKIIETYKGSDLVGLAFEPHYDFYKVEPGKKAFVVVGGDFVTADEGTGIVTIAAYGEEDLTLMQKENIQIVLHVDDTGIITKDSPVAGGMYYLDANEKINEDLRKRGLIYREDKLTHSVAHCWRCHTRLYYAPQNAWFVNVQDLKARLKKNNEVVNWFPKHFKYGRFLKSMEAAPDWCISRSRYWGSPVPVWECECGEMYVPGSIKELEELSGTKIKDLHKPEIDEVTIKCKKCGKDAKRVPEVLDSWIEAGSASFAERHFPFEKGLDLKDFFPPDFIVEYTGQIRAWFYVLHVIGTALYDSNAFKNVVVTGVILGTDGRKMSKNYGNYPDPKQMLEKYGGDALRLYLMGSPVMHGEDILISEEQYRNQVRGTLLILWNIYNFFVTYANIDGWSPNAKTTKSLHVLDKWILSLLNKLVEEVTASLESYDTVGAIASVQDFIGNLSNWYIRRSRNRVGPGATDEADKSAFYETTQKVLTTLTAVCAPIIPFTVEEIYKNLTKEKSVHLSNWPKADGETNEKLIDQMKLVREVVEKAHAVRKEEKIPVRKPLSVLKVKSPKEKVDSSLVDLIKDEVNVKEVKWVKGESLEVTLDTKITPELEEEAKARELVRKIQGERRKLGMDLTQMVDVTTDWMPKDKKLVNYVTSKTLINNISEGAFKVVPSK